MTPNPFFVNRSAVYGIRNVINNKIYVGRSICPYVRCSQYLFDFKNRALGHINDYLFNSFSKYGIENFEMFVLEFCPKDQLIDREHFWITQLNSNDRSLGYNIRMDTVGGGMITSEETSIKISNNLKAQWAKGLRNQHSAKMKARWKDDEDRKLRQGEMFTRLRTKWQYKAIKDGVSTTYSFKEMKVLGYNCMYEFYRKKSNRITWKGIIFERELRGSKDDA